MNGRSVVLIILCGAVTGSAEDPLIDANTRNGSFESGIVSPWQGGIQVAQNPAFASDGSWYATVETVTPVFGTAAREGPFQFFQANPADGRTFLASFDARNGIDGFDYISVGFFARSSAGIFINAAATPLLFPSLSTSEWGTHQVQYQLPETWDGDGEVSLQILFYKNDAAQGATYVGYLDNISLVEVPEPSTFALLGIAGMVTVRCAFGKWGLNGRRHKSPRRSEHL